MSRRARYDDVAEQYDAMFGDGIDDPATAALLELLGEVRGSRVLDLPCGSGRVARALTRRGADVVAADLSAALLAKARALEATEPLGVTYLEVDASAPDALDGERFDAVACSYGFSDLDDIDGALATFVRVLRPDGVMVFSLLHPCFPGWGSEVAPSWPRGGYYREGFWRSDAPASDLRRCVGSNHRMLSTYVNTLVAHGFAIDALVERALDPWPVPDVDPLPMFLAGRCRRVP